MTTIRICSISFAVATLAGCGTMPRIPDRVVGQPPPAAIAPSGQQDYSPSAMFHQAHGNFMARKTRYEPDFTASVRVMPDAEIRGDNGDFDLVHYTVDGVASVIVDPDSVLRVGGHFGARNYEFGSTFAAEDTTLYGLGLHLGYGRFLSDDTLLELMVTPGVYTDFGGTLKGDDWQVFGSGKVTFQYADDLYLVGGVEISEVFEDVPVYPVLGLGWLLAPEWRLDVLAPRYIELSFQPTAAEMLFAGLEINGNEYHLRASPQLGTQELDVRAQEIGLYVGGLHRFSEALSTFAKLGVVVGGHNEFGRPGGPPLHGQLEPALLLEVGVGLDF